MPYFPCEVGMYYVQKRFEISAAHRLNLDYASKCGALHGHNWVITVHCRSRLLNANGMVIDFSHIKEKVASVLDHANLNDVLAGNPTAENIAFWIARQIGDTCYRVSVQESEGNCATWELDE